MKYEKRPEFRSSSLNVGISGIRSPSCSFQYPLTLSYFLCIAIVIVFSFCDVGRGDPLSVVFLAKVI